MRLFCVWARPRNPKSELEMSARRGQAGPEAVAIIGTGTGSAVIMIKMRQDFLSRLEAEKKGSLQLHRHRSPFTFDLCKMQGRAGQAESVHIR